MANRARSTTSEVIASARIFPWWSKYARLWIALYLSETRGVGSLDLWPTDRVTTYAMPLTRRKHDASLAGARRSRSRVVLNPPYAGISIVGLGGSRFESGCMAANVLASFEPER